MLPKKATNQPTQPNPTQPNKTNQPTKQVKGKHVLQPNMPQTVPPLMWQAHLADCLFKGFHEEPGTAREKATYGVVLFMQHPWVDAFWKRFYVKKVYLGSIEYKSSPLIRVIRVARNFKKTKKLNTCKETTEKKHRHLFGDTLLRKNNASKKMFLPSDDFPLLLWLHNACLGECPSHSPLQIT